VSAEVVAAEDPSPPPPPGVSPARVGPPIMTGGARFSSQRSTRRCPAF
jgi:hypothetical protein